jgi:thiosulfate reductase cytochrome b subunit
MWILVGNALVYFSWGAASGHFAKFFPLSPGAVWRDLRAALRLQLAHERGIYNAVQKLLYLGVLLAGVMVVISGLAIWKPVQLWFFCDALGGYFAARYVHFFSMAAIAAFVLVHVILVVLVPKSLPPMLTGGRIEE